MRDGTRKGDASSTVSPSYSRREGALLIPRAGATCPATVSFTKELECRGEAWRKMDASKSTPEKLVGASLGIRQIVGS